jgi:hypothetical protein
MQLPRWTSLVPVALAAAGLALGTPPARADVVDFEDADLGGSLTPPSPPGFMGDYSPKPSDPYGSHDFTSKGVTFSSYTGFDEYYYWGDWAISNMIDTTTRGYLNQYSAIAGGGAGGSQTFGVLYGDASGLESGEIAIPAGLHVQQASFTNTTYAYWDMLEGGPFSDALEAGDWLDVTIRGYDAADNLIGDVVLYLADYRSGTLDILDDWQTVDLSGLAGARSLRFVFDENPENKDDWGFGLVMSHPSYLAMDNLVVVSDAANAVPEPSTLVLAAVGAVLLLAWRRRSR